MRLGARWWYSTMTLSWGIVATSAAAIQDRTGLVLQRFFLGITEAGAACRWLYVGVRGRAQPVVICLPERSTAARGANKVVTACCRVCRRRRPLRHPFALAVLSQAHVSPTNAVRPVLYSRLPACPTCIPVSRQICQAQTHTHLSEISPSTATNDLKPATLCHPHPQVNKAFHSGDAGQRG